MNIKVDLNKIAFTEGFMKATPCYIDKYMNDCYNEVKDDCENFYESGYAYGILYKQKHTYPGIYMTTCD